VERQPVESDVMPYGPEDFSRRAEECVRLANMTKDAMIQRELLELRQIYLQTATRLLRQEDKGNGKG
jgi:hypothetical protein